MGYDPDLQNFLTLWPFLIRDFLVLWIFCPKVKTESYLVDQIYNFNHKIYGLYG